MNGGALYWFLVAAGFMVFVIVKITRRGKMRIAAREAPINLRHAQEVEKQAQEDLRAAQKNARGEILTDEELLTLASIAVNAGIATPEQRQLVLITETVQASQSRLAASQEGLAQVQAAARRS